MLSNQHYYHRIIRKMVVAFGTMFNNIHLVRSDKAGTSEIERIIVPLAYAEKEKFYKRITQDPGLTKETMLTLPRMGFTLDSITYDPLRKISIYNNKFAPNQSGGLQSTKCVPYNFSFTLSIYVRNVEDGTQIIEQIIPYFNPDYTLSMKLTEVESLTNEVPIILESINQNVDADGGSDTTRILTWDLTFTMKGYFYGAVSDTKLIRSVAANTFSYGSSASFNEIQLCNGSGNYKIGEMVYEGYTVGSANSTAYVESWNPMTNILTVVDTTGVLKPNGNLVGVVTGTSWEICSISQNQQLYSITVTPDPLNSNPDDDFGYTTTINDYSNNSGYFNVGYTPSANTTPTNFALLYGTNQDISAEIAENYFSSVVYDSLGYMYCIGGENYSTKSIVVKFDPNGILVWQKVLFPIEEYQYTGDGIILGYDNNLIVTINRPTWNPDGSSLVKINCINGDVIWVTQINNTEGDNTINSVDITVDSYNNIYAIGNYKLTDNSYEGRSVLMKFNTYDGSLIWKKMIAIPDGPTQWFLPCELNAITIDSYDNIYLVGTVNTWAGVLLKYDFDGYLIWKTYLEDTGEFFTSFTSVATDSMGCVYLSGNMSGWYDNQIRVQKRLIAKYYPNGDPVWQKKLSVPETRLPNYVSSSFASSITIDDNDNLYLSGVVKYLYLLDSEGPTLPDSFISIVKLNKNASIQWQRYFSNDQIGESGQWWQLGHRCIAINKNKFCIVGNIDSQNSEYIRRRSALLAQLPTDITSYTLNNWNYTPSHLTISNYDCKSSIDYANLISIDDTILNVHPYYGNNLVQPLTDYHNETTIFSDPGGIYGNALVGETLTLYATFDGTLPITYTYQWYRGSSIIDGAIGNSYIVGVDDVGSYLSVVVTATNPYGTLQKIYYCYSIVEQYGIG